MFRPNLPIAVVVTQPRAIAADLARAVIGPDHAAVTARIGIIARIGVIGRRVVAPVKMMMPVMRRYAIASVTDAAIAQPVAAKHRRRAKGAAMDGDTAASKAAAVKCRAAAAEAATTVKPTAATTSAAMAMSATNLDRHLLVTNFANGAAPGLASDNASARCGDAAASTKTAAAASPRRRTRPRP